MNAKNLLKSALLCTMLIGVAGCGCNDDSSLPTFPQTPEVVGVISSIAPPIPVEPNDEESKPIRIDVTFVLDDSDSMNRALLGIIPNNDPFDQRVRTKAAQAIMQNLEQRIRTRLQDEYVLEGQEVPELDFAFAVARFEDFGGSFTNPNRTIGDVDADIQDGNNPENDTDARPFILNLPILRQNRPDFAERFKAALQRTAPGDGNPRLEVGLTRIAITEPQTGIEALYQIAAPQNPDGSYGGFDADGIGGTLGSGQPTSLVPARNPQTKPGSTGDVPAIGFAATTPDADGEDQFNVTDELGNVVMIPDAAGAPVPSTSSGNIGGVGWRADAARFVILASDIATVAPVEPGTQFGTKEPQAILPPPAGTEMVTSTDGAPDAPRGPRSVLLGAFDSGFELIGPGLVVQRRIGIADGPTHLGGSGIAPVGAHTVQETIDRLNALDIEVLLMGTPFRGGLDTKPGDEGVNGDRESDIGDSEYDPSDPNVVKPDRAPWFWFNAVTRLTMPKVTSVPLGGGEETYPAVYNLGTVWDFDILDPDGSDVCDDLANGVVPSGNLKNTVTDDLIERVRDWVDNGYVTSPGGGGGGGVSKPPLPTVTYKYTLNLSGIDNLVNDVLMVSPVDGLGDPITLHETILQIPVHYDDEATPADVPINFPTLSFVPRDDTVPLPAVLIIPFTMTAQLDTIGNQTPDNASIVQKIKDYIIKRGDGTNFDGMGDPIPLANENQPFSQASGAIRVTIRDAADPAQSVEIALYTNGSFILNDLTPNKDHSNQLGGSGAAFPPPPP